MKRFDIKTTPRAVVDAATAESAFSIQCRESEQGAELIIMDHIGEDGWGDGLAARDVVSFLKNNTGPISVLIDSTGGSFYDGLVMYNAFLDHDGEITAKIQGLAFSAATLPAMGASKLVMASQSDFGIHRAWTVAAGNQNQLSGVIEWLAKVDDHLANIYQEKSGSDIEQINDWLDGTDDGTLFNAEEALAAGFADSIEGQRKQPQSAGKKTYQSLVNMHRQKIKSKVKSCLT